MNIKPFSISPEDKFWDDEHFDKFLPQKGFLTDFVLAGRGGETPTIFSLWSGIYTISSALKRDTFLHWGRGELYPNFYIFLISPPRICAKSHMINNYGIPILMGMVDLIEDPLLKEKKKINFILGKCTEEGLFLTMKPTTKTIKTDSGKMVYYDTGSTAAISISELATFINKKEYNRGLIEKLTDLYDCRKDDNQTTQARKQEKLRNIYVTLIGGTTPDTIKNSIPITAFGDGFISRVITICSASTRCFPKPIACATLPSNEILTQRLVEIITQSQGGYTFSDEANEFYEKWYIDTRNRIVKDSEYGKKYARMDIHLVKLSLIMRVQRYDNSDREISLQDLLDAKLVLEKTLESSFDLLEEAQVADRGKDYVTIKNYIRKRVKVERRQVSTAFSSRGVNTERLSSILQTLYDEGAIRVHREDKERERVSRTGKEVYTWVGKRFD